MVHNAESPTRSKTKIYNEKTDDRFLLRGNLGTVQAQEEGGMTRAAERADQSKKE